MTQPEHVGRNDVSERELFLLCAPSVTHVPDEVDVRSKYFGVLLACDAGNVDDVVITDLARRLIANGMRYFCSWGRDCERVHDLIDSVVIENDPDETEDSVIITMWLDEKSLDEALWQFLYVGFPANDYEDEFRADLAIVIANDEWADQIKARFSDLNALNTDVICEDDDEDSSAI